MTAKTQLRLGRIGFLNVLPIYHPLEAGILPHIQIPPIGFAPGKRYSAP